MDEGAKTAALIFRASIAVKEMILRMLIEALKAFVRHMEWLKQHNIKPSWKARIDKLEIKVVQATTSLVEKQLQRAKDKIIDKERAIDKFKLDKQYELESKYKVEVDKAKKALEIELGKENKDTDKIAEKQVLLDQALENKRLFEYETNKELMAKNHELENCKKDLKECEYDLKICDAKLNALYSHQNIETGRVKKEYQDINEKYNSQELDVDHQQEEKFTSLDEMAEKFAEKPVHQEQEKDVHEEKEVELSVDELIKNYDKKQQEVNIDDVEKDVEIDIVAQMFAKEPEALKIYQDKKEKGDFKLNVPELSKDKGMDIGGM